MPPTPQHEIDDAVDAVAMLHNNTAREPSDERAAGEAMANLWSGFGWQSDLPDVTQMLVQATEIGYIAALQDVRDGNLDEDIRMWRPELAEG